MRRTANLRSMWYLGNQQILLILDCYMFQGLKRLWIVSVTLILNRFPRKIVQRDQITAPRRPIDIRITAKYYNYNWHLKICKWCNNKISTVQSPSRFLQPPCHYYFYPIIDSFIIKNPSHVHLAMNQWKRSIPNEIWGYRTTRTVGNILLCASGA